MCSHDRPTPRVAPLDRLQAALFQRGLVFHSRAHDSFVVSVDAGGRFDLDCGGRLRVRLANTPAGEKFVWGEDGEFAQCVCEPGVAARRIDQYLRRQSA